MSTRDSGARADIYELLREHGYVRVFAESSQWDDWFVDRGHLATRPEWTAFLADLEGPTANTRARTLLAFGADLWHKVGGLDARFKLAGDWDLWRRMATHAPYVTVDTAVGLHRRRSGQLSEQMERYYAEADARLDAPVAYADVPTVDPAAIEADIIARTTRRRSARNMIGSRLNISGWCSIRRASGQAITPRQR